MEIDFELVVVLLHDRVHDVVVERVHVQLKLGEEE